MQGMGETPGRVVAEQTGNPVPMPGQAPDAPFAGIVPAGLPGPGAISVPEGMPIYFDRQVLAGRAASERRRVIMNAVSLGITLVGLGAVLIYVFASREGQFGNITGLATWLLSVSAVISLVTLGARLVWFRRLRAAADAVGEGLALVVSRWGIQCASGQSAWESIDGVAVAKARRWGSGYRLRVDRSDGPAFDFPLEGLSSLPGTLDSSIRAYSSGRYGVDLSVLDD
ncbi:MAG: hypothetical protein Q4G46_03625 [Propionibacteriaceae bacterium]|nr:hypothetical protein [Propionibacteriaceae bacterium]